MSAGSEHDVAPVVTTQWLKSELDSRSTNVRVLDVTWASNKDAYAEYKQCHIPGANHFDIMHNAKHTELFPRNIPDVDDFQNYARSRGVNNESHVVVYDSTALAGFFIGSRAWWMFKLYGHERVSVLEGGLQKWIAEGYPTSDVEPECQEGDFSANIQTRFVCKYDDMLANVKQHGFQVLDSRPGSAFDGTQQEALSGHYPGAKNLPFKSNLLNSESSAFRTKEELSAAFRDTGVDLSRPVVSMCNSGMSSCSLALAAHLCGAKDFAVYHGGFTEWRIKATDDLIEKTAPSQTS